MRVVQVEQGTAEWLAVRAGKVTASRIKDMLAATKSGGEAAGRRDYRVQLVTETLTGAPAEPGFTSKEMEWGTQQEPFARAAYEILRDVVVDTVGFVLHPTIDRAGCSPDGIVGWSGVGPAPGIVQFKCPKSATHIGYILAGVVPEEYVPQMTWELACTGAPWCDFVSFDPRMPEHLQLFIVRLNRDGAQVVKLEGKVREFLAEVDEVLEKLEAAVPRPAAV